MKAGLCREPSDWPWSSAGHGGDASAPGAYEDLGAPDNLPAP
ncbi:MAG: hypothetical protein ORN51_02875 [Akkermansiaceae bacterium]|nr:hypothetical protein [Akkermansiaceae bacterium]